MTYCLGILTSKGLILASDSRSNAGVDQIQQVRKLALFTVAGDRVIGVLSQGNLATTQSVITQLRQAAGKGETEDLYAAKTLFDVASIVGAELRKVLERDARYVRPYGDPAGSFLVGGQVKGEAPRLFEIYSAGNFVEATPPRSCFLQIGETKYGKPILDRALLPDSGLEHAAKLALLSFDATMRSNLSVGMPIDMLRYEAGSFSAENVATLEDDNAYWRTLRDGYASGLSALVDALPAPPEVLA